MLIFWWWLGVWSSWLTVLDAATPPPPRGPPEHPPDGCRVIDLAHWRRTHPTHNGWAA